MHTDITTKRTAVYRLTGLQLVLTIVITVLLLLFVNGTSASSALLGGLAFILPNACFVKFALKDPGQMSPNAVLSQFYIGEAGKLLLTIMIFAACFLWVKPVQVIALFATYLLMIIVNLTGTALISQQQRHNNQRTEN